MQCVVPYYVSINNCYAKLPFVIVFRYKKIADYLQLCVIRARKCRICLFSGNVVMVNSVANTWFILMSSHAVNYVMTYMGLNWAKSAWEGVKILADIYHIYTVNIDLALFERAKKRSTCTLLDSSENIPPARAARHTDPVVLVVIWIWKSRSFQVDDHLSLYLLHVARFYLVHKNYRMSTKMQPWWSDLVIQINLYLPDQM